MQWGDLASWAAAVGTISAVFVALWLARREGRGRSQEERRRQAELITAWVDKNDPSAGPWVRVMVANASNQVAYRLVVSVVSVTDASPSGVRPPYDPEAWRRFISELPPGRMPLSVD